jgi:N-acetylmuramic acid 6-phosphate etherase
MMNVNIKKITTETRNPNTLDIDRVSTVEIVKKINNEDKTVAYAVEKAIPEIAKCVDMVYETFMNDGRLIYMGAGTSGRIGLIDAVECRPTYGVSPEMVQCLMAGGAGAMIKAVEGAEDSKEMAVEQLKEINLNKNDVVIGITASGRTPYAIGAVEYAKSIGCKTGSISTSINSEIGVIADYPVEAVTGAEPITGSTRMKSGTAQKLICNMISTASMIKMGKVYGNLMIDVQPTNQKLVKRAQSILTQAVGISNEEAQVYIDKYNSVKKSLFAILSGIEEIEKIDEILDRNYGNIRDALKEVGIQND